ncbi:alpha/beta fold hydrolase [Streptomyces sp. NPDC046985]|uniref:thioesterase II family protein n=1 Tax=Streptomyces sp. NPDC046985 TaxID=3155377 RepID=UPI0033FBB75B
MGAYPAVRPLRPRRAEADNGTWLLIFPHAGGSPSAYRRLAAEVSGWCSTWAVHYPGRQDRIGMRAPMTMDELIDDVTAGVNLLQPPRHLLFLGHSMGAYVAYETALRMQGTAWEPQCLIVSAALAPTSLARADLSTTNKAIMSTALKDLSALPEGLSATELLAPVRSDLALLRDYSRAATASRVRCPLLAVVGDTDALVDAAGAAPWQERTTAHARHTSLPGDHFYFQEAPARLARLLRGTAALTADAEVMVHEYPQYPGQGGRR